MVNTEGFVHPSFILETLLSVFLKVAIEAAIFLGEPTTSPRADQKLGWEVGAEGGESELLPSNLS